MEKPRSYYRKDTRTDHGSSERHWRTGASTNAVLAEYHNEEPWIPDSTLVERCLSGDDAAWEELVRLHTRRVYGLCYRFTGKDSEAQDLTQDVFMRVFRALGGFRSTEGSFTTWLTRLTRNLLIDHYRRTRNERVTDSIEEQLPRVEEGTSYGIDAARTPRSPAARPANCCRARWRNFRRNCARRSF